MYQSIIISIQASTVLSVTSTPDKYELLGPLGDFAMHALQSVHRELFFFFFFFLKRAIRRVDQRLTLPRYANRTCPGTLLFQAVR